MSDESSVHSAVAFELTGLIYDSVDDASRWAAFLEAFARAVDAPRCALLIRDTESGEFIVVRWHGWPDEDIQLYFDRYGAIDLLRTNTLRIPEGEVAADYELAPREQLERNIAFREFYAPRDCIHSFGGIILTTRTGQSVVSCHRGAEAGPFGEKEKSILRSLMPHLKRAALLHGELGSLRRRIATFTGHLERYPYGFLVTDAERRVLYSNAAAREIVAAQDGLAIENGRLIAIAPQWESAFGKALAQSAADPGSSLHRLEINRPSRRRPYRLILMPIDDSRTIPLGVAVPALSILIIDPDSLERPDQEVLRELFSFTPAEARVSASLVLGQNAEEIAAESKTSVETVRTHIKRILSKTSTSRQSELVSLILRSMPFRRA
jgi:DNA-binding CsgD family transcriptional regulator